LIVTVTGAHGFVGRSIAAGLRAGGHEVRAFDRLPAPLARPLRRRWLGTSSAGPALAAARRIRAAQRRAEAALAARNLLGIAGDDILDLRSRLAARFAGSDAVIHLAAIPHPFAPGVADDDFRRINYDGSVNVFEAARDARVRRFLFASSAQVYRIHDPVRVDRFPIDEAGYLPSLEDGQTMYGFLKAEFERYLQRECPRGETQGVALRLEYPGVRASSPNNFYVCSSLENLHHAVDCALRAPDSFAFEAFNVANREVDPAVGDVKAAIRARFPDVPDHTTANQSALSVEKATRLLGYQPRPPQEGTYFDESVMW
jgi:nucleoside-diphosphate-sugar epimerase